MQDVKLEMQKEAKKVAGASIAEHGESRKGRRAAKADLKRARRILREQVAKSRMLKESLERES